MKKENQDWSKKWKEKWTVTHVTNRIAVVPSWLEYSPREDEIIITLDPGCFLEQELTKQHSFV